MTKKPSAPEILKSVASHFSYNDWVYSRDHSLEVKSYMKPGRRWRSYIRRLPKALHILLLAPKRSFYTGSLSERRYYAHSWLTMDARMATSTFDGYIKEAAIYVMWEEDGEYLELVQPSVGILLADFLIKDPKNPHAVKITAELTRLLGK